MSQPAPTQRPAASDEPVRAAAVPRSLAEAWPAFARHPSPRILLGALAAAAVARVFAGPVGVWDAVAVGALLLVWPVQEWLIHVHILHAGPLRVGRWSHDFAVPRAHRAHHRDPWRLDLVFIPVSSFLYSIPVLVGLWLAATRDWALALTGISVHLLLALHYEWVHFLIHTAVTPRGALYRRLWKNHRRHHFKNENYWYGVTMLGGDRLFGTAPPADRVPTSPTARSLAGIAGEAA